MCEVPLYPRQIEHRVASPQRTDLARGLVGDTPHNLSGRQATARLSDLGVPVPMSSEKRTT